jgi:hypothetical protein
MSDMFAALEWWRSFHRNPNFWDWVRDVNSDEELVRLTQEATDSRLGQQYDPFGEHFGLADPFGEATTAKTTRRLMKKYGSEIWWCCLGAAGFCPENQNALECLSKLSMASEVHNQTTFEEFLVRNALKIASEQLIKEGRKRKP